MGIDLVLEEFASWQRAVDVRGLRVTRCQHYRDRYDASSEAKSKSLRSAAQTRSNLAQDGGHRTISAGRFFSQHANLIGIRLAQETYLLLHDEVRQRNWGSRLRDPSFGIARYDGINPSTDEWEW